MSPSDKTSEIPSTREDISGGASRNLDRPSLGEKTNPEPKRSQELERGTELTERHGVPLGGGGAGGGNMGVDTSATDKLPPSEWEKKFGKFGEIRIPKAQR